MSVRLIDDGKREESETENYTTTLEAREKKKKDSTQM